MSTERSDQLKAIYHTQAELDSLRYQAARFSAGREFEQSKIMLQKTTGALESLAVDDTESFRLLETMKIHRSWAFDYYGRRILHKPTDTDRLSAEKHIEIAKMYSGLLEDDFITIKESDLYSQVNYSIITQEILELESINARLHRIYLTDRLIVPDIQVTQLRLIDKLLETPSSEQQTNHRYRARAIFAQFTVKAVLGDIISPIKYYTPETPRIPAGLSDYNHLVYQGFKKAMPHTTRAAARNPSQAHKILGGQVRDFITYLDSGNELTNYSRSVKKRP